MNCRVIKKHKSDLSDPLILKKGENVKIEHKKTKWHGWIWCISYNGNKGWVPESYLKIYDKIAEVLEDYNAIELTVKKGEIFKIKKEVNDWIWVTSDDGKFGWIPKENVEIFSD
jgi:uncharacterized protein YgiM (DUF1202 family)